MAPDFFLWSRSRSWSLQNQKYGAGAGAGATKIKNMEPELEPEPDKKIPLIHMYFFIVETVIVFRAKFFSSLHEKHSTINEC